MKLRHLLFLHAPTSRLTAGVNGTWPAPLIHSTRSCISRRRTGAKMERDPHSLSDFGNTARDLSRSPLGILALFIVLVYALAALVVTLGSRLTPAERKPLVWFLALFPLCVLLMFGWLVSRHSTHLYAPKDFRDEV